MSMSSFRVAPRQGHLERVKRICGYLSKFRNACIRIRTDEPDYSDLPKHQYDWARSVYGEVRERKAHDAPEPKGKPVVTTTYKDANLYHDLATGRAVTGVLHFLNQTPIDWYTKKQETVETATYGSEFAAARTAIQQIAGLRQALQYLGVPLARVLLPLWRQRVRRQERDDSPLDAFKASPCSRVYHYTREAVASKMVSFHHIGGDINPADVLSKHWGHSQVYPMLRPLLFYKGDTLDLIEIQGIGTRNPVRGPIDPLSSWHTGDHHHWMLALTHGRWENHPVTNTDLSMRTYDVWAQAKEEETHL